MLARLIERWKAPRAEEFRVGIEKVNAAYKGMLPPGSPEKYLSLYLEAHKGSGAQVAAERTLEMMIESAGVLIRLHTSRA